MAYLKNMTHIYKTFSNSIYGKERTSPDDSLVQVALTSPVIVALWMSIAYHPASGGQLDLHMCVIIVVRK